MKVTYIAHSGFLAETEHSLFLFDYFKGEIPELPADKPLYVFASHRHEDHFNPKVFHLAERHRQVKFILAFDIRLTERNFQKWGIDESWKERILSVRARQIYHLSENCKLETLKSTDAGVAFLITEGKNTIYHAGDLN